MMEVRYTGIARTGEVSFALVFLISFFVHVIIAGGLLLPDFRRIAGAGHGRDRLFGGGRDIIVNVNQDGRRVMDDKTLLSDKDSAARGHITNEKGDHWLNNSLEFRMKKGKARLGRASDRSSSTDMDARLLIAENTELIISRMKLEAGSVLGQEGGDAFSTIPDRNTLGRHNAIFYSNDGRFSFNTVKFRNFKYFKAMKDNIASHWFPPLLANSSIMNAYTPGRLRIMAIPSQEVKLYFTMNRSGTVLDVVIVDSLGNVPLDSSCVDAIRYSKNFGKVPEDIKGEVIIIPFIFGYYVY